METEERTSQPSGEMAEAEPDPMSELVALLQYEERQEARQSLQWIRFDWQNLLDRMENYTVDDIGSPHDSDECKLMISTVRCDMEAMQERINWTVRLMPQLHDEEISGGEKLLVIKKVTRTIVRGYLNHLRDKLNHLKTQAAEAAARALFSGGAASPAGNNDDTALTENTATYHDIIEDSQKKGQFEWKSTSHISSVGLMAQKSDKTFEIPTAGTDIVTDQDGQQIFSQVVEQGDLEDFSLQSLRDFGSRTDEDEDTNGKKIHTTVACLFPELYGKQILDCEGRGEAKLKNDVTLVLKVSCVAQQWLLALRGRL